MEELLSLKWNNHKSTFIQILTVLREKHVYTDVTLACDGKFYSVHKLVLSTCSDYFSAMLERTNCKNPVIVLKDIKSEDLEALLDYMYLGEVNVKQSDLATLIKAAECLRVKGLAVPDDEPLSSNNKKSARDNISRRSDTSSSPPPKRKRRSDFDDGRDDVKYNHISSNKPKNFPVQDSSQLNKSSSSVINSCEGIVDEGKTDNKFNTSQSKANIESDNDITEIEPLHKVKVEVENNDSGQMDNNDSFSINNEDFKEENDLNSDLPEFLQDATHDYPHSSFAGPSFQPDMTWPDGGDSSQGAGLSTFSPPSSLSFANISQQDGSLQHGAPLHNILGSMISSAVPLQKPNATTARVTCGYCGRVFEGRNRHQRLQFHTLIHTGEKPHPCPHCDYRARLKFNLRKHILIMHTYKGENDLGGGGVTCPVCGKQLSGRNGKQKLQYHMLTHTGEKRFMCPYCTYRAALKFNLVSHIKNVHKVSPGHHDQIFN